MVYVSICRMAMAALFTNAYCMQYDYIQLDAKIYNLLDLILSEGGHYHSRSIK